MLARVSHAGPIRLGEQQLTTQNLRQAFTGPSDTLLLKVGNLYLLYVRDRLSCIEAPDQLGSLTDIMSEFLVKLDHKNTSPCLVH